MSAIRKKFDKLGLKDNLSIVHSARRGIRPTIFYSFAESAKLAEKDLAILIHLHPRTLRNYNNAQKNLDLVESEHLLKLIALYAKGEELMSNVAEFNNWLNSEVETLKGKPYELLSSPGGIDLVSDELDKLAHGYAV